MTLDEYMLGAIGGHWDWVEGNGIHKYKMFGTQLELSFWLPAFLPDEVEDWSQVEVSGELKDSGLLLDYYQVIPLSNIIALCTTRVHILYGPKVQPNPLSVTTEPVELEDSRARFKM